MAETRGRLAPRGENSVDTSFSVGERQYHVFAFPTPGRRQPQVRWNLYEVMPGPDSRLRGLTFGLAKTVEEALDVVVRVAERHERTGEIEQDRRRQPFTFRPLPSD
ncbi:MAG: hypothetical protein MUC67_02165 [Acidobacteria bacterium]|jgi:hypothetical protein|nr:hypothetical protein [Acidobacteriota bacterium]